LIKISYIRKTFFYSVKISLSAKPFLRLIRRGCIGELSQRQKDHNNKDNLFFLEEIAISFYSVVKSIRNDRDNPQYRIRTTNLKANLAFVDYLTKYPLFSTKGGPRFILRRINRRVLLDFKD